MMTKEELKVLQSLPLEIKIEKTKLRIKEWYEYWKGNVYVSFSGGKDSTVLLHIARSIYPDIKAVFCDTGLEFPEIKQFVKSIDNIEIIRPEKSFVQVIKEHGYPVISKEISLTIEYARMGSQWAIDRLNGNHNYGNHKKYKFLLEAPFKISDKCCKEMKKKPFKKFEKSTGLRPILGTMASEEGQRQSAYLKVGCNAFNTERPQSQPLGFWTEEDILDYINKYNIDICPVYDMGYKRTGCMFCMFGINIKEHKDKFLIMKQTHPQLYQYCMKSTEEGGLGLDEVLTFLNIDH